MKHFSNKQFLAAIATLTLTGAAMAQDGRSADGKDQTLSPDELSARQVQGQPGADGPIPSKSGRGNQRDKRDADREAAAKAREVHSGPGTDGPVPREPGDWDARDPDARAHLAAETTDRSVTFELSSSETKTIGQCGVILISLSPDLRQQIQDYPWLLWDSAVLGFGDLAPTLSLAITGDYVYPDLFYAQGVVIASNGNVQASEVVQISSR